jgi:hypothetical protein
MKALSSCLLAFALAACALPIQVPAEFAQQRGAEYALIAATADEAVLRVRDVDDPTTGSNAKFWIDALRTEFVEQRGYVEVARDTVPDVNGVEGEWVEFTTNVRGERVDYLAAVWARRGGLFDLGGPYLQVVEFAARSGAYASRIEAVKASLRTVRE